MLNDNNTTVEYNSDNEAILHINSGDHAGIKFKFGKVWVDDSDIDNPSLQFQYEVVSGTPYDKTVFEDDIAKYLHETILNQLETGQVHYSGGTEPNIEPLIQEASTGLEIGDSKIHNIGQFKSEPKESAMSFLDRIAISGMQEMKGKTR